MDTIDLPPWAQTVLTVLGVVALFAPSLGRLLAIRWPELGARVEAFGVDLRLALGRQPVAGTPRSIKPGDPLPSVRAEVASAIVEREIKAAPASRGKPDQTTPGLP